MVRRNVTRWVAVATPSDFRPALLTAQQAAALVAGTRDDWYGPLWALLLGASLRISEALGLGWDDYDGSSATSDSRNGSEYRSSADLILMYSSPTASDTNAVTTQLARREVPRDKAAPIVNSASPAIPAAARVGSAEHAASESVRPKRKMAWVRVPWTKADRELERIAPAQGCAIGLVLAGLCWVVIGVVLAVIVSVVFR